MNIENRNIYQDETIVAIATPIGTGAISIVRLSGTNAYNIALKITNQQTFKERYTYLKKLYDFENNLIDEALVIYFRAPFSFTGEDVIEFQCHGGVALTSIILDTCIAHGAKIANPGEFSKRAFFNEKIDLTQAQAISKIIEAKSASSVKLLAKQLKGDLKNFIEAIRQDLLYILAYVEVSIDYAEEDLPQDIYQQIQKKLLLNINKLEHTVSISKQREGLLEGFKIAIIGKPNVGKSSLLNSLLNYERAIVSDIAGTTRDTIEENIKVGSHIIKIIDTAGIRESNESIEQIGIERTRSAIHEADIIISLFDNSRTFDDEDQTIVNLLNTHHQKEIIFVLNKCDLKNKFQKDNISKIDVELSIKKDIQDKSSVNKLIQEIKIILDRDIGRYEDTILITKTQIQSVEDTLNELRISKNILEEEALEFFSHHISTALEKISTITRPYEHSQMLDIMFGEFCLGK